MRLTRLRAQDGQRSLDLHSRLTVVAGLGAESYQPLIEAVCTSLASLEDATVIVVGPETGGDSPAVAPDPRIQRMTETLENAYDARAAVAECLDLAEAELRGVKVKREVVAAELTILRARLDPFASAAVATASAVVDRLTSELGAVPGTGLIDPRAALATRVMELERRLDQLEGPSQRPAPRVPSQADLELRAMIVAAEAELADEPLPSTDALVLADEWEALLDRLSVFESRYAPGRGFAAMGDDVEAARVRLDAVMGAPGGGDPMRDAQLESAHRAVVEAEEALSAAPDDSLHLARFERALTEQQHLLAELGFSTWSAYVMRDPNGASDRAESARRALATAEAAWTELVTALQGDPDFGDLFERLADCSARAEALVGDTGDRDPLDVLRELRVDLDRDAVEALRVRLAHDGLAAAESASAPVLITLAKGLLAERDAMEPDVRADRIRLARETADELAEARVLLADMADLGDGTGRVAHDDPRLIRAQEGLERAKIRLRRHHEAVDNVTSLVEQLDELDAFADHVLDQIDAQRDLLEATTRLVELAQENQERVRNEVDPDNPEFSVSDGDLSGEARLSVVRDALNRIHAAEPALGVVLVAGLFDGLASDRMRSVLDNLVEAGGRYQVVVLTEDPAAIAWAFDVGPDIAGLASV